MAARSSRRGWRTSPTRRGNSSPTTKSRLIGEAAARLIPDNSSLFINIGTTTEEVAKALSGHSGLLVITNNLHVASELYRNRAIEVIITGGTRAP